MNLKILMVILKLPTSIKEINNSLDKSSAKKKFNKNSSIKNKKLFIR